MPSKSPAQHRFMEAAAHNPKFAAEADIPQSVAKEFVSADAQTSPPKAPSIPHLVRGLRRRAY